MYSLIRRFCTGACRKHAPCWTVSIDTFFSPQERTLPRACKRFELLQGPVQMPLEVLLLD